MTTNTIVLFWLISGVSLCILEFTIPTAFVEFIMGISAIIVAFIALLVPNFSIQVAIWLVLSTTIILVSRRFVPVDQPSLVEHAEEAKTLTEVPSDELGRILYEGCSWQARCANSNQTIAPDVKVQVIGRHGNTLIVVPKDSLKKGNST